MNLTSIDGGKQCLNLFLNLELFWVNNKAVIEFTRLSQGMKNFADRDRGG